MNEATIKSYRSIIENMNSGFISIINSKIVRVNKILNFHLLKTHSLVANIQNNNSNRINMNNDDQINIHTLINNNSKFKDFESLEIGESNILLNALFKNINFEINFRNEGDNSDYENILEFLKSYEYDDPTQKDSFIFLGTKEFKYEASETSYYEIFGRYSPIFKEDKEDKFEFLFNDVSKTKISENINAEMKYKTIFLSKVAHEFKNPLICVAELVDQVNDQLDPNISKNILTGSSENQIKENLTQIKSMCEYLLILVKDLDFFSLQQAKSTNKIKIEKDNVKLDKVINYCKNVTNVLLKKYQKETNINFKIDCEEKLYFTEIFTDELRLKQLLVNLLSNSVKYTFNGYVSLKIQEEFNSIVFKVIDTGKGLTDEEMDRLKTDAEIKREIGANSSSLGFSIIREIIDVLESKLYYELRENNGSIFSFSIVKDSNINCEDYLENITILSKKSNLSQALTIAKEFNPFIKNHDRLMISDIINANSSINSITVDKIEEISEKLESDNNAYYYIVVDDEQITRKSTIRMLNNYFNSKERDRKNIILEATDGIECLHLFYQCVMKGMKLCCIISDQTMEFMNGQTSAKIINEIERNKNMKHVPFMILSAYENLEFDLRNGVDKTFTKPISKRNLDEICTYLLCN